MNNPTFFDSKADLFCHPTFFINSFSEPIGRLAVVKGESS